MRQRINSNQKKMLYTWMCCSNAKSSHNYCNVW